MVDLKDILKKYLSKYLTFIVYLFILTILMAYTLYSSLPFGESEGLFIAFASETLKGSVMYKDLFDHQTPLFYYLLSVFLKLFGTNLFIFRFLNIIMMALVALFVEKTISIKYKKIYGFLWDLGFTFLCKANKYKYIEIPCEVHDMENRSTVKNLKDTFNMLLGLIVFRIKSLRFKRIIRNINKERSIKHNC